jgi:hypothetical protein
MAGRQAKTLTDQQIETLFAYASATRNHFRDRVIVLDCEPAKSQI